MGMFYLLRPDGRFSDAMIYPEPPAEREDGTWVEGEPEGLNPVQPAITPSLADKLSAIFDVQEIPLRAQFAPLRAAIAKELELGHIAVAKEVINQQVVPEELQPIKDALLAVFDEVGE